MGKGAFIKPRKAINLKGGSPPKIKSNNSRPVMQRSGTPSHHRSVTPDEGQEDAVSIDPIYVLPDGSINYWAGITSITESDSTSDKKTEDE